MPPEQVPKPDAVQLKVQPEREETVCVVAGAAVVQSAGSVAAVPSERMQVLVRVSVAVVEQVEDGALQALELQLNEQAL